MRRNAFAVALILCLATYGGAQVINATLFGTVSDPTGALIPGVDVSATNTETGVVTNTVTSETGTYRFPSLQPGIYEVSASLPGFQTQTYRLTLGTSQQIARNFTLQVGTQTQAIEVSVAADELLTTSLQSVAETLPAQDVIDLPLVGRNVMDIATLTVAGVQGNGGTGTTFAGIEAGGSRNLNIQVDGMTVNNGRHEQGLAAATNINPDMVEEVRLVVAAVDVESLGSAQFQVRTKSGTNNFHGAAVWNYRNSALDANSWSNNRLGIDQSWYSQHQYTASIGGPIVRNKTFFFALFDGQRGLAKESEEAIVLTPLARQGIFRFFPGVNNDNADGTPSGSGNTLSAPVVDFDGNPLDWTQIPGATGPMQSFNVFGDSLNSGDPNRTSIDTVYMQRLIQDMPMPNAYDGGDGLNTALMRWTRRSIATSGVGTGGNPDGFNRRQLNIKIDHNINDTHRLMGSWSREHRFSDNNELSPWPNGWGGTGTTDPSTMTIQLTSILSPTLLNEFKFGRRVTTLHYLPSYSTEPYAEEAWDYMPVFNGIPVLFHPTLFTENMLGCSGYCGDLNNKSPLNSFSNTLSWTTGAHALKFGFEVRRANTFAAQPNVIIPHVYGGAGDVPVVGIDTIPGLLPRSQGMAQDLLLSLSGSVNDSRQRFEIREPTDTQFLDFRDTYFHPDNPDNFYGRIRDWHQNEVNFFVKDDWQVARNLTLNLGIRYDLMQVPYLRSASGANFTPGLLGGNGAAFGYSGRDFNGFMTGGTERLAPDTQTVLIGEGTDYPDQGIWKPDHNNWAPAIGFAWSPDFLGGEDRTTIRGGYQVAYQLPGPGLVWIDLKYGNLPGFFYEPTDFGDGSYRDFSNTTIPLAVDQQPFEPIPLTQRSQTLRVVDENFTTPYIQTFTFGVTRSLASNMTLDVKYVGTKGTKLQEDFDINAADFRANSLLAALNATRAGEDAELFDRMLGGLDIGSGVVGVDVSGSEALRQHPSTRTDIANGDFVDVAEWLNTTNSGTVQEGDLVRGGLLRSSGLFPENFIVANPQFGTVSVDANMDHSIYHSLQTQFTLRETHGVNYQATYTWSKSLGVFASGNAGYRDPANAFADYTLQNNHRTHAFRSYGNFRLPFGPGRIFGGSTSGVGARLIEGWQVGLIFSMTSGNPMSVSAGDTLYAGGGPDIVGDFPRKGDVRWGDTFGNYFGQQYQRVNDPQCTQIASGIRNRCTIDALADEDGNIVLQHPQPGQFGTLGLNTIEGPGRWDVDMNFQKRVQIGESQTMTIRFDAANVFNHPTPGNPSLNLNGGTFGQISNKTGNRTMQVQIRYDF